MLRILWISSLGVAAILFVLAKCFFLAPGRAGRLLLLANALYETLEIKLRLRRAWLDGLLLIAVFLGTGGLFGGRWAAATAAGLGLVWVAALMVELRWKEDRPARQYAPTEGRVPLPVPRLIVILRGPVLRRSAKSYLLGDWPEGVTQDFECLVLNPGRVRPQWPLKINISSDPDVEARPAGPLEMPCPEPAEVLHWKFALVARRAGGGGCVRLRVSHGDWHWERTLCVSSVLSRETLQIQSAAIRRWKYGARAGFVWRGDQDLYDPATFQSVEGLRFALDLARRFRMPTSLMLSSRLSLYPDDHAAFCRQFGWDRHSAGIPDFIRFLREEVDTSAEQEFPVCPARPYAAEIGNHGHLHWGTHTAADPGNGWRSHARIGTGKYPWLTEYPCDSFTEQRDNIAACSRAFENILGFRPSSYTPPGDVYDAATARAVEAAGIEVGTETDATKWQKLLVFPPEHHPQGCERLVELTRMLPRDPVNAPQIAMLKYWLGFARRHGRALVFLAHHHLRQYEGNACANLTAEFLRHVLADTEGDVYPATLTALGRYWRDVLSPRTRILRLEWTDSCVQVRNSGDRRLTGVPVEIHFGNGRRLLWLTDVPPQTSVSFPLEPVR